MWAIKWWNTQTPCGTTSKFSHKNLLSKTRSEKKISHLSVESTFWHLKNRTRGNLSSSHATDTIKPLNPLQAEYGTWISFIRFVYIYRYGWRYRSFILMWKPRAVKELFYCIIYVETWILPFRPDPFQHSIIFCVLHTGQPAKILIYAYEVRRAGVSTVTFVTFKNDICCHGGGWSCLLMTRVVRLELKKVLVFSRGLETSEDKIKKNDSTKSFCISMLVYWSGVWSC